MRFQSTFELLVRRRMRSEIANTVIEGDGRGESLGLRVLLCAFEWLSACEISFPDTPQVCVLADTLKVPVMCQF
jgi:hypothetical protein